MITAKIIEGFFFNFDLKKKNDYEIIFNYYFFLRSTYFFILEIALILE